MIGTSAPGLTSAAANCHCRRWPKKGALNADRAQAETHQEAGVGHAGGGLASLVVSGTRHADRQGCQGSSEGTARRRSSASCLKLAPAVGKQEVSSLLKETPLLSAVDLQRCRKLRPDLWPLVQKQPRRCLTWSSPDWRACTTAEWPAGKQPSADCHTQQLAGQW